MEEYLPDQLTPAVEDDDEYVPVEWEIQYELLCNDADELGEYRPTLYLPATKAEFMERWNDLWYRVTRAKANGTEERTGDEQLPF